VKGADSAIKSPFYAFLKQCFPLFEGAEDDLTYSGKQEGVADDMAVAIVTARGDTVYRRNPKQNKQEG
jgi:hypothetical protein